MQQSQNGEIEHEQELFEQELEAISENGARKFMSAQHSRTRTTEMPKDLDAMKKKSEMVSKGEMVASEGRGKKGRAAQTAEKPVTEGGQARGGATRQ
jgi:hypothetical protein